MPFLGPAGTPAPTGVQWGPLHCGRRPLRVFSGNLCMQADVGIGPYEGNGPYPKGEAFVPSKRDGAAGRHGTRGKYAAGGGQNGQQDIGHTQGGSQ